MTESPVRYRLAPGVPDAVASELTSYAPLTQTLLYNRGVTTAREAETFLTPSFDDRHDPFLMTDMERAVERVLRALAGGERIVVYSDYDCDGIPGGVLLHDALTALGAAHLENYIPHRHDEGYGMSVEAVGTLAERGAELIISVDCGTADLAPIARAKEKGIDVIVLDHHEPGPELPDAYALLNPKRDDAYPFRELCGTGVAWKLVEALLTRAEHTLPEGREKWWLDVVGLATIADMVPLRGENRTLAHYGLTVLRKTRRPGLRHLMHTLRLDSRKLSEDDLGFSIGPRINAASRMDTPEDAFRMLATDSEEEAGSVVRHLEKLNNERKGAVAAMVKEARRRTALLPELRDVLVLGNPAWRPALAGLAANSLAEAHGRSVFLWGRDGRGVIKGSCRAAPGASVVALMDAARDAFIEYGGHHASGGFSVRDEHIHTLEDALNEAHRSLGALPGSPRERTIDGTLTLGAVGSALMRELDALAPYGVGNEKPLFAFPDVVPTSVAPFGKNGEHLKATFGSTRGTLEAVRFFASPESFVAPLVAGEPVTLIAHVEHSQFRGRSQLRLRIEDVLPAEASLC